MNKFHNRKTTVDGITFDSAKEAARYAELKLLERAGKITELQRQPGYTLVPKQVRNGKMIELALIYKADFAYHDEETNEDVVEDVKGLKTREYIIKRKLMLWEYGIRVREV